MVVYLTLTVATFILSLFVQGKTSLPATDIDRYNLIYRGTRRGQYREKIVLLFIFVLLVGVSALRLNVGNDYSKYVEFMHRTYSNAVVPTEPGFNILTKVIYRISGFENYVLVFAIFSFFTILFFMIGIYELSPDFVTSFMMFMLLGYYFQSLSTVRYYLALGIALYAMTFFFKRDYPRFVLLVLVGALFHKSLLVVLILYPLAKLKWKRWMLGIALGVCLSCLFFRDMYLKILIMLYPSYAGTEYLTGGTSKVSIIRCIAILLFAFFVYGKTVVDTDKKSFYFYANLMALAFYTFGSFIPTVSRICYYLTVTQIIYIPEMILDLDASKNTKKARLYGAVKIFLMIACIGYFIMYMRSAGNDGIRILPYETFLFHEMPATLSERGFG